MKIAGKACIVLGGAQGIGRAFCEALLKQGGKLVLCDILTDVAQKTTDELKQQYGHDNVTFVFCNVVNKQEIEDVFTTCLSTIGCHPDIVVNTAGVIDEFNWQKCLDVNIGGTIQITERALNVMSKEKGGKGGVIVHLASISGLSPEAWGPVYSASKFAMVGYVRSWGLKKNYDITGVRVNCLCPTTVDTPFISAFVNSEKIYYGAEISEICKNKDKLMPSHVAGGLIELIEDDSLCGEAMRVSKDNRGHVVVFEEHPLQ